ncbi:DNA-binding protein [Pyrodictium occultum]|uniref:DNA-binding protein n=1 Tax=Pyrodictium occultum TaxID=2309 RepID=A0A0V8RU02_PYROC|nr:HEPN domain-containing protein [Pyrodictium occultum]KSW11469.1 DNA-binding protein [Pyrodictium occultum]
MSGEYPRLLARRAEAMLRNAERLQAEGEHDLAVLNAEYAAQLYLKALLYRLTGEEWRGHSIRSLLGALALVLRGSGFDELAGMVEDFVRSSRRILAELEEARVRAVYGPFEYSRSQAEAILEAARKVVGLARRVEERVFQEPRG